MNTTDRYAKIREALEMRPTPGSREVFDLGMWDVEVRSSSTSGTICQVNNKGTLFRASEDGADRVGRSQGRLLSDAFFIAACDPDTIRELLAERDALAAENERLRAERVWQPIETAPMDGTKVDLWVVDPLGEGKRIPDCSWGWGQWIGSKGLAAERLGHKATHWIYRPTPPQEKDKEIAALREAVRRAREGGQR